MRKHSAPVVPWLGALEAAINELPAPDSLTPEQNLRVVAVLDEVAECLKRRQLELWVKIALDEYRGSIPIRRMKKAS